MTYRRLLKGSMCFMVNSLKEMSSYKDRVSTKFFRYNQSNRPTLFFRNEWDGKNKFVNKTAV